MSAPEPIMVYNRDSRRLEPEKVLGEGFVRFIYETAAGRALAGSLLKRPVVSRLYGWWQDSRLSAGKINGVAESLGIDLSEAEKPAEAFESFNDFFTRTLKKEARPIDPDPSAVVSPCDARLLACPELDPGGEVHVKGSRVSLSDLVGEETLAARFEGGAMMVYRLCPSDYHRFHFPEACVPGPAKILGAGLHSVNPVALSSGIRVLDANLRQRTLLDTRGGTGPICMVEVGALLVGSIVQTYTPGVPVNRGDEKGMFRFGGSTVIVFYEKGHISVDEDILRYSQEGTETLVRFGRPVGKYRGGMNSFTL